MAKVSPAAMAYRTVSASRTPARGAMRAMGMVRNRSNTPLSISSRSWTPAATDAPTRVWIRMPGTMMGR